ncbi:MAG: twin-arginine translocation signal domain-containing protein, partial [Planctomycetota bacterium]
MADNGLVSRRTFLKGAAAATAGAVACAYRGEKRIG